LAACLSFALSSVHAQTQAATNATAREDFARADADLNKTYQAVLKKLPDTESKQKLKEAQRAWIASRDAEATRAADEARGGSMAPTLRYETMTELTRQRIKQLETRLTSNAAPDEKDASTPSLTPTATSSASAQESDKEPAAAAPNPSSVSPDKKWEYNKDDPPKIIKAGTNEVALELDGFGGVLWAPDSKRFACYSGGGGRSHTTFLYQLRGDEWKELQEPIDAVYEILNKVIAAQVKKRGLPKKTDLRLIWETVEVDRWVDSNTAILYAGRRVVVRENLDEGFGADFLLTLKFDEAGHCKIVKTHRMSDKEVEKRDKAEGE
jgi:uncharacterized protein YecT (DUF1311 family)